MNGLLAPDPVRGLRGGATLTFCRRGAATVLSSARVEAPLKLVRPFALADGRLVVPLITLGPGFCGGDSSTIDVHVEADARVVIMNTAATRVMGMADDAQATQRVRLTAGPRAHLEYYPGLTIPFPDSAFVQTIDVRTDADARVGVLETWAFGRIARDEYLRFRHVRSRTTVHVDRTWIYADATVLEPRIASVAAAGVLDRRKYLVSGFWYGGDVTHERAVRSVTERPERGHTADVQSGGPLVAFGQPASRQVFLRALGDDGRLLDGIVRDALARVADGWRVPPVRLERFRC
jgi:urease accessory protein